MSFPSICFPQFACRTIYIRFTRFTSFAGFALLVLLVLLVSFISLGSKVSHMTGRPMSLNILVSFYRSSLIHSHLKPLQIWEPNFYFYYSFTRLIHPSQPLTKLNLLQLSLAHFVCLYAIFILFVCLIDVPPSLQ